MVHIMREHKDFIPELDFVLELDGEVIGNVMYTRSKLTDESGQQKEILTFGPLCVLPGYQRMGYGKMLLEYSFEKAAEMGYLGALPIMWAGGFKAVKNIRCLWKTENIRRQ